MLNLLGQWCTALQHEKFKVKLISKGLQICMQSMSYSVHLEKNIRTQKHKGCSGVPVFHLQLNIALCIFL